MIRRVARAWALAGALGAVATGAAAAVPGEVADLRVGGAVLSWGSTPEATTYNVYRGYLRDLGSDFLGTTLEGDVSGTSLADAVEPAPGEGFFYVVTAANGDGEGTMGAGAGGSPRVNAFPWPGLAVAGRWSGLQNWPCASIHMAVLRHPSDPAGWRLMTFEGQPAPSETFVWDPVLGTQTQYDTTTNIFCSGHSFLPDGRLLATGGDLAAPSGWGMNTTWTFDPADPGWVQGPDLARGRYYPTNTAMGDGRTLVFGGLDQGLVNDDVEAFVSDPDRVEYLGAAYPQVTEYPHMLLLDDGRVFQAGPINFNHTYDPVTGVWEFVAESGYGFRTAGNSVLLPGTQKVMTVGGYAVHPFPTETVEIIDLAQAVPAWRPTSPMRFRRMNHNTVLLPDGKVLVLGGGYDDVVPVYPSEVFDPATETWSVAATMHSRRLYHSAGVLLPDGRVIAGGSNDNYTVEFYAPGYLFRGPRPTIASAPASVEYGQAFTVTTPDAASIASVTFMRPGAATHAFDQDQRQVPLSFTAGATSLQVLAPSNPNTAPPGYYMLFLLDGDGVPSVARFVQLQGSGGGAAFGETTGGKVDYSATTR